MRIRFTGAIVAMAVAAAVSLTVMPLAGQAGRALSPRAAARGSGSGQGRGAAAPAAPAAQGRGAAAARPARIAGKAEHQRHLAGDQHRQLEPRGSLGVGHNQFWQLGAIARDPGGSERRRGRHDPVPPGGAEEARGEPGRLAEDGSRGQVLHARAFRAPPTCRIPSRSSRGRRTSCSSTSTPAPTASST